MGPKGLKSTARQAQTAPVSDSSHDGEPAISAHRGHLQPRNRGTSTDSTTLGAALTLGLAVYGGFLAASAPARIGGFICIALGGLAFVLLGLLRPSGQRLPFAARTAAANPTPSRVLWLGTAVAAISNLAGLAVWTRGGDPNLAWSLYGGSVSTILLTAWLLAGRPPPRFVRPGAELWFALALLCLAAGLRLYKLDEQPFGLADDEAMVGLAIKHIIGDPNYRPVFGGDYQDYPALYFYASVPFVLTSGATPLGVRLSAALAGTVGVLAVYLLAREIGGRRYALVAGVLLAMMAWHLNFSRIAFNAVWSVALDALACLFFVRALRRASIVDGLLGGVSLGLGLHMYHTSRLLPLILALYLLHCLVADRLALLRRAGPPLLAFSAATLLTVSPVALHAALRPAEFFERAAQVSIFNAAHEGGYLTPLWSNVTKHFLMFNAVGDDNGRHNLPGAPMLDPITGALFLVGLLYCLPRLRRPAAFLLVAWVPIMLLGGILSREAPHGLRTLDEVTGVALLAALPATSLWSRGQAWLEPRCPPWAAGAVAAAAVLLLSWIGSFNIDRYFNLMARNPRVVSAFSAGETLIARELASLPGTTRAFVDPVYFNRPSRQAIIRFLAPEAAAYHHLESIEQVASQEGGDVIIFLSPNSSDTTSGLRQRCPHSEVAELRGPHDVGVLVYVVSIPATPVRCPERRLGQASAAA
jgi:hypothetical protein